MSCETYGRTACSPPVGQIISRPKVESFGCPCCNSGAAKIDLPIHVPYFSVIDSGLFGITSWALYGAHASILGPTANSTAGAWNIGTNNICSVR